MLLDDLLADGQAQARAAHLAGALLVHAVEGLKQALGLLVRKALAPVDHAQAGAAAAVVGHGPDGLPRRAVLDGVVDQVDAELAHALLPAEDGQALLAVEADGAAVAHGLQGHGLRDAAQHRRRVHGLQAAPAVDVAHLQQLNDHAVQARALVLDVRKAPGEELPVRRARLLQELGIALDGGQRGLELVGDVVVEGLAAVQELEDAHAVLLDAGELLAHGAQHGVVVLRELGDLVPGDRGAAPLPGVAAAGGLCAFLRRGHGALAHLRGDARGQGAQAADGVEDVVEVEQHHAADEQQHGHRAQQQRVRELVKPAVERGVVQGVADDADRLPRDGHGHDEVRREGAVLAVVQAVGGAALQRALEGGVLLLPLGRAGGAARRPRVAQAQQALAGEGVERQRPPVRGVELLGDGLGRGAEALLVVVALLEHEGLAHVDGGVALQARQVLGDARLDAAVELVHGQGVEQHAADRGQRQQPHRQPEADAAAQPPAGGVRASGCAPRFRRAAHTYSPRQRP